MKQAFRASIYHCLADPGEAGDESATQYFEDGLLVVDGGNIVGLGDAVELLAENPDIPVEKFPGMLIVPGLIDCHVHFPQVDIIASHGEQLLDWLNPVSAGSCVPTGHGPWWSNHAQPCLPRPSCPK